MADQVDSLTDADLQAKLAEHGFKKIPVTTATRKTLVRKLKSILENKSKFEKREGNKVNTKESLICNNEESTLDTTTRSKDKHARRATTGVVETKKANSPHKISRLSVQSKKCEESPVLPCSSKANEVDLMSDAELQATLVEHGYPVVPITATTRTSLVKKLKLILKNKSTPDNQNNKNVENKQLHDDSDEQSNLQTTTKAKRKRDQNTTVNELNEPPRKILHSSMDHLTSKISLSAGEKLPTSSPLSPSDTLDLIRSSLDITSSLADHLSAVSNYTSSSTSSLSQSSSTTVDKTKSSTFKSSALQSETSMSRDFKDNSVSYSGVQNSIRSNLDLSSIRQPSSVRNYTTNITPSTYQPSNSKDDEMESPFLSDFGKRLHALKSNSLKTTYLPR